MTTEDETLKDLLARPAFYPIGTRVTRFVQDYTGRGQGYTLRGEVIGVQESKYYAYTGYIHTVRWDSGPTQSGYMTCGLEKD